MRSKLSLVILHSIKKPICLRIYKTLETLNVKEIYALRHPSNTHFQSRIHFHVLENQNLILMGLHLSHQEMIVGVWAKRSVLRYFLIKMTHLVNKIQMVQYHGHLKVTVCAQGRRSVLINHTRTRFRSQTRFHVQKSWSLFLMDLRLSHKTIAGVVAQ